MSGRFEPSLAGRRTSTVVQLSTLQAVAQGLYSGLAPLDELTAAGNVGIGTFEHLDGEMTCVDSTVYRFDAGGRLHQEGDRRTPFFIVTELRSKPSVPIPPDLTYRQLKRFLLDRATPNLPHVVCLHGTFRYIQTRSLPLQTPPYPRLLEVTRQQSVFDYRDTRGIAIGFYFPDYLATVTYPGFHLHFVDDARSQGGHVLDFVTGGGAALIAPRPEFRLVLPGSDPAFHGLDLSRSMRRELEQAEGRPQSHFASGPPSRSKG